MVRIRFYRHNRSNVGNVACCVGRGVCSDCIWYVCLFYNLRNYGDVAYDSATACDLYDLADVS